MARLTASMVVDLTDKTGAKTQVILGNLNRLKRAERDLMLSQRGLNLSKQDRAMERYLMEREAQSQRQMESFQRWGTRIGVGLAIGGAVVGRSLLSYAELERKMTRIGITADATAQQTKAAFATLQTETKRMAMPLQDGIDALDTMVASGMKLQDAMAFMPAVLATAQATGSATTDIANTAIKTSSALGIMASRAQFAFDIMATGGKAGQFELNDMSQYLPGLANSFASLGYKGEEGLKMLIAVLQTLREDTGDAASAATQASNIFGKMYSEETANKFGKFGINLRKEMEKARAAGEDALTAFIRLSKEALNGDLTKLPLLFTDQEFRLGMQSLITSPEKLKEVIDLLNSTSVEGTVMKDIKRVTDDAQASVDRLKSSWDQLLTSLGAKADSMGATDAMDWLSTSMDKSTAIQNGMDKRGLSWLDRRNPMLWLERDQLAYEGGYRDEEFLKAYWEDRYSKGSVKPSTGRQNQRVVVAEFPGGDSGYTPKNLPEVGPYPSARPDPVKPPPPVRSEPRPAPPDVEQQRGAVASGAQQAEIDRWSREPDSGPGMLAEIKSWLTGAANDTTPKQVTLSGTPAVTITNPPPRPNVNVTMSVTIHEAQDPQAVARQLGQAVRDEMNGLQASTNDSGL